MNIDYFVQKCLLLEDNRRQDLLFWDDKFDELSVINCIIHSIKKYYKFNISKWDSPNQYYPEYLLLNTDKGILGYICFSYYGGKQFNSDDLKVPLNEIIRTVSYAESRLNRPIFFVKILNYKNNVRIIFETSDQIKDRLFNESSSISNDYYNPNISLVGDFKNLMRIWDNLKKVGVKIY